jgi:hypothetical protein
MDSIKLGDAYSLAVEAEAKRLRLIILDKDAELVCHKTTASELGRFLQQTDGHLFKGRLQLHKTSDHVAIIMKGEIIGSIPEFEFQILLNSQNTLVASH